MKAGRNPEPALANRLSIDAKIGETEARAVARAVLQPSIQAALTIRIVDSDRFPDLALDSLVAELADQSKTASSGDMARMEAMLIAQAHTLDALFHRLTRLGAANVGLHSETAERYLRLALKTQSQARATAKTLYEMKHPTPLAFVRQANISHGSQLVNNGSLSQPRAAETWPIEVLDCQKLL